MLTHPPPPRPPRPAFVRVCALQGMEAGVAGGADTTMQTNRNRRMRRCVALLKSVADPDLVQQMLHCLVAHSRLFLLPRRAASACSLTRGLAAGRCRCRWGRRLTGRREQRQGGCALGYGGARCVLARASAAPSAPFPLTLLPLSLPCPAPPRLPPSSLSRPTRSARGPPARSGSSSSRAPRPQGWPH